MKTSGVSGKIVECEIAGGVAVAIPTDVSDAADVDRLAQRTLIELGPFDVWINDAGVGALGPFERVPLADHVKVMATNLLGTLYGTYAAYRQFVNQHHGILINIASELGRHTVPYYASYAASKHGVVGLTESLRQELALRKDLDDVHVCVVMPTAHDTPFFDHAANYTGHEVQAPPPLHDPQDVVDALVSLVENPKDSKIVGADGVVKILLKSWRPASRRSSRAGRFTARRWSRRRRPPTHRARCARRWRREPTSAGDGERRADQRATHQSTAAPTTRR